jgi:hypothetical protein
VDDSSELDFLAAFGDEFCEAMSTPVPFGSIVPQDSYDVWWRAFGRAPTPSALAAMTTQNLEELRAASVAYFECPAISVEQVRLAVSRTLARWPST